MAGITGFEPVNDGVKVRCLTAWLYPNNIITFKWGERRDSNSRHPEPQPGALPTELLPPYGVPLGIRTPDPRLRRALLYPAELKIHIENKIYFN